MDTCCPHPEAFARVAPGRYCLAVCYCTYCPHYVPLPPPRRTAPMIRARQRRWDDDPYLYD